MVFHPLNELVVQLPWTCKLEPYYSNGIRVFGLDLRLCASEMRRGQQAPELKWFGQWLRTWAPHMEITPFDSGRARPIRGHHFAF